MLGNESLNAFRAFGDPFDGDHAAIRQTNDWFCVFVSGWAGVGACAQELAHQCCPFPVSAHRDILSLRAFPQGPTGLRGSHVQPKPQSSHVPGPHPGRPTAVSLSAAHSARPWAWCANTASAPDFNPFLFHTREQILHTHPLWFLVIFKLVQYRSL